VYAKGQRGNELWSDLRSQRGNELWSDLRSRMSTDAFFLSAPFLAALPGGPSSALGCSLPPCFRTFRGPWLSVTEGGSDDSCEAGSNSDLEQSAPLPPSRSDSERGREAGGFLDVEAAFGLKFTSGTSGGTHRNFRGGTGLAGGANLIFPRGDQMQPPLANVSLP